MVFSLRLPVLGPGCSKGQVSIELLTTLAIVIAFTIPVVFLLLSVSSVGFEKTSKDQADASARSLADSINNVYAQGPGAKRIVLLNTPSNTQEITVKGSEVTVKIGVSEGEYEGASPIFGNVSGTFSVKERAGLFSVTLENEDGEVKISEK